jgi:hypothetical protein
VLREYKIQQGTNSTIMGSKRHAVIQSKLPIRDGGSGELAALARHTFFQKEIKELCYTRKNIIQWTVLKEGRGNFVRWSMWKVRLPTRSCSG